MSNSLRNKHILLGVTGSIACYKSVDLASKLRQAGAVVDVILTKAAAEFVSPLTFQSVTGRRAYTDVDLWGAEGHVLHIGLGKDADLILIAPATANTIARLAYGFADNLLSLTVLAAECPLLMAPAMDGGMYTNAATQANIQTLAERGTMFIGPGEGHLASGLQATGRMVEPATLRDHLRYMLAQGGPLAGKMVVITAGGTQEPLDPVRFITNRSTGKQGFALAQAALDLGAEVTLIAGPTHLPTPMGAGRIDVRTGEEMNLAVIEHSQQADALVMVAAVADFRPSQVAEQKIKKSEGIPAIELTPNPDILKGVHEWKDKSGYPKVTVGFAAESQNLRDNALQKLESKGLDFIVANDISGTDSGFGVDTNRVTLLFANGKEEELPLMGKDAVAEAVLSHIVVLLSRPGETTTT